MADELPIENTEGASEGANDGAFEEVEVEFTSNAEYIHCASLAWQMVDEIDTAILSKADEKRVKRMKRQSLKIVSVCLNEMYNEIFDDNDDNSDSE